jgi:cell division protein FtsL
MATYTPPRTPHDPREMPRRRGPRPAPAPADPRTRPYPAPRHTRPLTSPGTRPAQPASKPARPASKPAKPAKPARQPASRPPLARNRTQGPRQKRAPFILLLVGLLGGALVSLLVISTTLAQGSYRITSLQQQNASLAKQEQLLTQQVAQASSPAKIAQEAEDLGMRPNPALQFINLRTGKVVKGQVSKSDAEINVPGFTP